MLLKASNIVRARVQNAGACEAVEHMKGFFRAKKGSTKKTTMALVCNEIIKVRRDAVGGTAKTYTCAVVLRNNKTSARIVAFDNELEPCGTFTVKHNMLWKFKAKTKARDKIFRHLAYKKASDAKVCVDPENTDDRVFTGVKKVDVRIDGLLCKREMTIKGSSCILTIAWDSVTNCTSGAIVNAANEGCLGGGGIDGHISHLGGMRLNEARLALPTLDGTLYGPRCATGDAKMTIAGNLPCEFVIHAVGPRFLDYSSVDEALKLLASAYKSAMQLARAKNLSEVAFCIISAGIFRGNCSLWTVIETGLLAIASDVYTGLKRVYFCAYAPEEQRLIDRIIESFGFPGMDELD